MDALAGVLIDCVAGGASFSFMWPLARDKAVAFWRGVARGERVLDTVTGGDAERLYARAGWQPVGEVPHFALMPDGAPCGTTYFYKRV